MRQRSEPTFRAKCGHLDEDDPQPAESAEVQAPVQPAPAPAPPAGPSRQQTQERITEIEQKYMCAAPGTPEYATYWLGEAGQRMQAEYRDLVATRDAPVPAAQAMIAGGDAAPAEPAPGRSASADGGGGRTMMAQLNRFQA